MNNVERAQKKQKSKKSDELIAIERQNAELTKNLQTELETNAEFSLEVDPTDKYHMSEQQKDFIRHYADLKSIPMAAELSGIDLETAKTYFTAYSSQQEIRRINRAMYQRQFSSKLVSIDEIGRWLSSLLTDENVPLADRVKTMDKVKIAQMLIDLQLYKSEALSNPSTVMSTDIEGELKSLSVKSIKALISQKESKEQNISNSGLMPEEEAFLNTLPSKDLLDIIDKKSK